MVAGHAADEEGVVTDPFRAKRKATGQQQAAAAPRADGEPSRAELEDMRKAELVELAEQRGLDTDGTKADLVDRLSGSS